MLLSTRKYLWQYSETIFSVGCDHLAMDVFLRYINSCFNDPKTLTKQSRKVQLITFLNEACTAVITKLILETRPHAVIPFSGERR